MTVAQEIVNALGAIVRAPFEEPSSLWLLIPLFVIWIVLVVYFDIHKSEKLGWNTALGNALTLCWITLDLMRYLFTIGPEDFVVRFIVLIAILLYAIFLMFLSFAHKAKEKIAFALASPTAIYYLGMIAVLWGYGALEITRWVLLTILIIFGILLIILAILRKVWPTSASDMGDMGEIGGDLGKDLGGSPGGGLGDLGGGAGDMPKMPKF